MSIGVDSREVEIQGVSMLDATGLRHRQQSSSKRLSIMAACTIADFMRLYPRSNQSLRPPMLMPYRLDTSMINKGKQRIPLFQQLAVEFGDIVARVFLVGLHERAHFGDDRLGSGNELHRRNFSPFVGMPQPEDATNSFAHNHGEYLIGFNCQMMLQGFDGAAFFLEAIRRRWFMGAGGIFVQVRNFGPQGLRFLRQRHDDVQQPGD